MTETPKICDYEGSTYRTDFWEGQGRGYEDRVERSVLQRLLPQQGRRLLELGAGFGRLTDEYNAYDQVVLLDYSFSQLQYARQQMGDARTLFVAANIYKLPFKPGVFDGATMIRVLHHMVDVPAVFEQIRLVMAPNSTFILEYANKHNLKAMLRHALGRQEWSPYTPEPVEFVELNFDFHPDYVEEHLGQAGFKLDTQIPVSFFRLGLLKRTLPAGLLASLDRALQTTGWRVSPSIFTRSQTTGESADNLKLGWQDRDELFICPESGTTLHRDGDVLVSETGLRWAIRDGVYDFKEPVQG